MARADQLEAWAGGVAPGHAAVALEAGTSVASGWELRARAAYGINSWLDASAEAFVQGQAGQPTDYGALAALTAHF